MTVTLSPELSAIVQSKVDSGRFSDTEEVLREALELLNEQEKLERLRAAVAIGFEQLERGEEIPYTPGLMEEIKREARLQAERGHQVNPDVIP